MRKIIIKAMRTSIIIFFLLGSAMMSHAQTDEKLIKEIFYPLFDPQTDTLILQSQIDKTYFDDDSTTILKETGLKVPRRIISEWKKNIVSDNFISEWDEHVLNKPDTIYDEKDTIIDSKPVFVCMSKRNINLLFEKTKKRQPVYAISKILYDDSGENAIFDLTCIPWPGDFSSQTIFIKKIFGKWIIVSRFHFLLS
jgi:hypothetical protein